jgi:hypothetical protein
MSKRAFLSIAAALAAMASAASAEAAMERGVLVIRGPGGAVAERSLERNVRVWRGERAAPSVATELAGAEAPKLAASPEKIIVIRCGRSLNRLRTQGFYSGHPGGPSRRFTQGFFSGGPDYRGCVRVSS